MGRSLGPGWVGAYYFLFGVCVEIGSGAVVGGSQVEWGEVRRSGGRPGRVDVQQGTERKTVINQSCGPTHAAT